MTFKTYLSIPFALPIADVPFSITEEARFFVVSTEVCTVFATESKMR